MWDGYEYMNPGNFSVEKKAIVVYSDEETDNKHTKHIQEDVLPIYNTNIKRVSVNVRQLHEENAIGKYQDWQFYRPLITIKTQNEGIKPLYTDIIENEDEQHMTDLYYPQRVQILDKW